MQKRNKARMALTADLARAAGTDAGNRHMSGHTLKPWNREAFTVAVRTTNRLLLNVPFEDGGLKGLNLNKEQMEELGITSGDMALRSTR